MTTWTAIIIGSGFGGQSAAIQLGKMGIDDFRILERRDFMGGTWLQNTYPGAAVDVQSPLYSLSDEPYDWTQMFADQRELAAYTEHIIDKHGLREKTELGANVTAVRWDEDTHTWEIETGAKGMFRARFLINASGPLSNPNIPDFEGKDTFAGPAFHTNQWDHDVDYSGKRVAVIGSGASAAQVIPAIAPDVKELHVFQRTPHWVLPRPDHVFSGIERSLMRNRRVYGLVRNAIYWALEYRVLGLKYSKRMLDIVARPRALRFIKKQVPDPVLRAKLTPDYTIGCKRVLLSNTLYPALGRENVTLHDKTEGIERVTESGIVTHTGEHVDLDIIIYATGFHATDGAIPYDIVGEGGANLADRWEAFPRAYLGTTIPDFPNLFVVTGPNTGIGHTSALFIIESQMRYIGDCIDAVRDAKAGSVVVRADAEERYTTMIHREMEGTVWQSGGCDSWYKSASGHVIAMFPGFSFTYRRLTGNYQPDHHQLSGAATVSRRATPRTSQKSAQQAS